MKHCENCNKLIDVSWSKVPWKVKYCKDCKKEINKKNVKAGILRYSKTEKGRKSAVKASRTWQIKNDARHKKYKKGYNTKYWLENKEELVKKYVLYRRNKIETDEEFRIRYYKKASQYESNKRKTDPIYRLIHNSRIRLNGFLKVTNMRKTNTTMELIGCTPDQLKLHLEKKFHNHPETNEKMTWDNYGRKKNINTWEVDHIIPISRFENPGDLEVQKLFQHYSNLQPLWAFYNRSKGSKIIKNAVKFK